MRNERSRRKRQRRSKNSSIDIIPLIDVVFLMLCFFVLLSISMVYQRGVPIDLAEAATGKKTSQKEKTVVVTVKKNGEIYFNKKKVQADELKKHVSKVLKKNTQKILVIVNADKNATHSDVITTIDILRKTEVKNILFSVKPSE